MDYKFVFIVARLYYTPTTAKIVRMFNYILSNLFI